MKKLSHKLLLSMQLGVVLGVVLSILLGFGLHFGARLFTKEAGVLHLISIGIPVLFTQRKLKTIFFFWLNL